MFMNPSIGAHLVGSTGGGPPGAPGAGGIGELRPAPSTLEQAHTKGDRDSQLVRSASCKQQGRPILSLKKLSGDAGHHHLAAAGAASGGSAVSPVTPLSPVGSADTSSISPAAEAPLQRSATWQEGARRSAGAGGGRSYTEDFGWLLAQIAAGPMGSAAATADSDEWLEGGPQDEEEQEEALSRERVGVATAEHAGGEGRERRGEAALLDERDCYYHLIL